MKRRITKLLNTLSQMNLPRVPQVPRWLMALGWIVGLTLLVALLYFVLRGHTFAVLQTKGEIGDRERNLLYFATALAVLVLVPVYLMLFMFAWRYRSGHKRTYRPEWDSDKRYETVWWSIPIAIITVLALVTWVTSHSLDPYKKIASHKAPLTVQVIALEWKWLFIYPGQSVASVNELNIPVDTPVNFAITSDAPMNSFWIPQLGGQVYAMSGMVTQLSLIANHTGDYMGVSSNISGKGFADMQFTTHAISQQAFDAWVETIHQHEGTQDLTAESYAKLAQPGTSGVIKYHVHDPAIFSTVLLKYMDGMGGMANSSNNTNENSQPTTHDMHAMHMEGM